MPRKRALCPAASIGECDAGSGRAREGASGRGAGGSSAGGTSNSGGSGGGAPASGARLFGVSEAAPSAARHRPGPRPSASPAALDSLQALHSLSAPARTNNPRAACPDPASRRRRAGPPRGSSRRKGDGGIPPPGRRGHGRGLRRSASPPGSRGPATAGPRPYRRRRPNAPPRARPAGPWRGACAWYRAGRPPAPPGPWHRARS